MQNNSIFRIFIFSVISNLSIMLFIIYFNLLSFVFTKYIGLHLFIAGFVILNLILIIMFAIINKVMRDKYIDNNIGNYVISAIFCLFFLIVLIICIDIVSNGEVTRYIKYFVLYKLRDYIAEFVIISSIILIFGILILLARRLLESAIKYIINR